MAFPEASSLVRDFVPYGARTLESALSYYDGKLKDDKSESTLGPTGVNIKSRNGYLDLGGEFQVGGVDIKIEELQKSPQNSKNRRYAVESPSGIGQMLMNGCFGSDYEIGDPCYGSRVVDTGCSNLLEAANYVGAGFDGTNAYTHKGRRKNLIKRKCKDGNKFQGKDVPDNMYVHPIYESSCTGRPYESIEARSKAQRREARMGENENYLQHPRSSVLRETEPKSETSKQTRSCKKTTRIFDFSCQIRNFEIYSVEQKPEQLSDEFWYAYMNLPPSYFDLEEAPNRYDEFLSQFGTHFIQSATFGGKFTLLTESEVSCQETENEWTAKMQRASNTLFESRGSAYADVSVTRVCPYGWRWYWYWYKFLRYEILVEGGDHRVATILSERNRAGIKPVFQSWLDSIPGNVEGYNFQFGGIANLVCIDFGSIAESGVEPCWTLENRTSTTDAYGNQITLYNVTFTNKKGEQKETTRQCNFNSLEDFQSKMNKRCLSLKNAVARYGVNRRRRNKSLNQQAIPEGRTLCEEIGSETEEISYEELADGSTYILYFNLRQPIGNNIQTNEKLLLEFIRTSSDAESGRWRINQELSSAAGNIGKKVKPVNNKVFVKGARFTFENGVGGNSKEFMVLLNKSKSDLFQNPH